MASTQTVYFLDGPCNGTKRQVSPNDLAQPYLTCKDNIYRFDPADSGKAHPIVYKWAGATSGGGTTDTSVKAPHAQKGWHDMQHSLSKNLPAALSSSRQLHSATLRTLSRARKVKH